LIIGFLVDRKMALEREIKEYSKSLSQKLDELKESERRYRALLNDAALPIFTLDREGKFTWGNKKINELTGYHISELLGKSITQLLSPSDATKLLDRLSNLTHTLQFEVAIQGLAGRKIAELTVQPFQESGEVKGVLCIALDATEKKELEQEIIDSYRYLSSIISNSADAIIALDTKGNILLYNEAAEKIFGYKREEVIGRNIVEGNEVKFYKELETARSIMQKLRLEERVSNIEVEGRTKNGRGRDIYISVSASLLKNEKGEVTGSLGVTKDITEHKQLENELKKAYEELKELYQRRMDFTNMAAHELRTPLQPIIGYLEMLKEEIKDERLLRYIEIMERNAMRLHRLVDGLLELSKLDVGKVELQLSLVDVNRMVQWLLDNYAPMKRKFSVDLPENLIIKADESKLFQILDNLISNAVKYSSVDSEVKIIVREREKDYLFKVIDQGIGIAKEDQKRIFERFYLVNGDKLSRTVGRIGLGLTLAKSYVELHGGEIWVESEVGKGSTFYFTIPKIQSK
jgi:PAS domain S-box-containing protein